MFDGPRKLFDLGTDDAHPLERFAKRLDFIGEQLNFAEDVLAEQDHIAASLDMEMTRLWDALEALQREVIAKAYEHGLLHFHAQPGSDAT